MWYEADIPGNARDAFLAECRPSWMACAETIKGNNATAAKVTPFVFHRFCARNHLALWNGREGRERIVVLGILQIRECKSYKFT